MGILWNILKKITPEPLKKRYRRMKTARYEKMSTKEIFTKIRDKNEWGSSESVSGPGSEIEQTSTLRMELQKILKTKNIKSILDVPCGDFNWMKEVDLSGIDYTGGDIVDKIVAENQKKHGSGGIKFMPVNIITDVLPQSDLIFVRDCFVHLSYKDIHGAIANIKRSGSKYLMTTTYKDHHKNYDILTGQWRHLNLRDEPFNFPEPEILIVENSTERDGEDIDKSMGLWLVGEL